jgi:dienelactone hydrolase
MQDDLENGVKWAVAQGIADPERVCFVGASYGGYTAMRVAIKNAKVIKCAVAFVGVSSIDCMFDNAQTDMSKLAQRSTLMVEYIGDPDTERARFKRVNPLDNADKVGVPILLAYGAEDVRVPLVHGTDFRMALDKYNKPTSRWSMPKKATASTATRMCSTSPTASSGSWRSISAHLRPQGTERAPQVDAAGVVGGPMLVGAAFLVACRH